MADPHEDQVDTDYSGRPYRLPTVEELGAEQLRGNPPPPDIWDIAHELPDGRIAVLVDGRYYITHPDGSPDRKRPVWIKGVSPGEPDAQDEVVQ